MTWDFKHDRLVLEYDNVEAGGGGCGNTILLDDGTLVTTYSYRKPDNKTYIEAMRWRLPEYFR